MRPLTLLCVCLFYATTLHAQHYQLFEYAPDNASTLVMDNRITTADSALEISTDLWHAGIGTQLLFRNLTDGFMYVSLAKTHLIVDGLAKPFLPMAATEGAMSQCLVLPPKSYKTLAGPPVPSFAFRVCITREDRYKLYDSSFTVARPEYLKKIKVLTAYRMRETGEDKTLSLDLALSRMLVMKPGGFEVQKYEKTCPDDYAGVSTTHYKHYKPNRFYIEKALNHGGR